MWILLVLCVALGLGLSTLISERGARLTIIPVILAALAYQALKYGLL